MTEQNLKQEIHAKLSASDAIDSKSALSSNQISALIFGSDWLKVKVACYDLAKNNVVVVTEDQKFYLNVKSKVEV
jgi:hypothetical protein